MSANWDILAQAVMAEMDRRGWSTRETARRSGMSRTTVHKVLRAQATDPSTWAVLERILCWRKGTVVQLLTEGRSPRPIVDPRAPERRLRQLRGHA